MRINAVPVTSFETRWFLEGNVAQQDGLNRWFQTMEPWPGRRPSAGARPEWSGRSGASVDVHLVIPGAADLGVKWRDGTLQVKGRMNAVRTELFCGRFEGRMERWVTWSYDDLSDFYRSVFSAPPRGVVTVPVRKSRSSRKVRRNPRTGAAEEVVTATEVEHGMTVDLTDIEVNGTTFCSLGFTAFPDDPGVADWCLREMNACLESLQHVTLATTNCRSFPAWLATLAGCNARPVASSSGTRRLAAAR